MIGVLLHAANGLAQFPLLGQPGTVPGTRERIVSRYPYRIIYHIVNETIEVLRIIHMAQPWP